MHSIKLKSPSECTASELYDFCRLVESAGSVDQNGLEERIKAARALLFLYSDSGELIGTSALKLPDSHYVTDLFDRSRCSKPPRKFILELGWIVVEEKERRKGYSKIMVEEIIKKAHSENVYATTRADNYAMKITLERNGFASEGINYFSSSGNYLLSLFCRDCDA